MPSFFLQKHCQMCGEYPHYQHTCLQLVVVSLQNFPRPAKASVNVLEIISTLKMSKMLFCFDKKTTCTFFSQLQYSDTCRHFRWLIAFVCVFQCGALQTTEPHSARSVPLCKTCCDQDYCNTNCTVEVNTATVVIGNLLNLNLPRQTETVSAYCT